VRSGIGCPAAGRHPSVSSSPAATERRAFHALEEVRAVGAPRGAVGRAGAAHGGAAGEVERRLRHQRLAAPGERHDPRRERLGDALDLDRLRAAGDVLRGVLLEDELAEVDARPRGEGHARVRCETRELTVVGERVEHGVDGAREEEQEAVGLVDLAPAVIVEEIAGEAVDAPEDLGRAGVAERLDELRRVDEVRQEERAHHRPDGGLVCRIG
jgi:hypothetical protein